MKTNGLGKESVLCSYCLFGNFEFFPGVAGYYLKHLRYLTLIFSLPSIIWCNRTTEMQNFLVGLSRDFRIIIN